MKILHLSAVNNWGGGENHIENLCYELSKQEDVSNYILCVKNSSFYKRLQNTSIPVFTSPLANKMDLRFVLKIGRICSKNSINLIHIHDTTALTLAVMATRIFKLPPFVFSKKTSFPIKNRAQTLYKYNHHNIKKILCVSEATKNITAQKIQNPEKLVKIYHGTNIDNKSDETDFLIREKLKLSSEKIIVGNIANHIRAKNMETLIMTANYLINERGAKDFHFVQMGRFSERTKRYKSMLKTFNLQNHFTFFDFVPNASNFIPQFDLKIISSQSEGLPQVIYEAFYHKIPVISTNVGGISEAITHRLNGLLAPAQDYQKLAEHILSLATDSNMKLKFTQESHKILLKTFTTKSMAEQTLAEYKKVLYGTY